jgi:hypothetical protein
MRKKANKDYGIPAVINAGPSPKSFRKNQARLLQKTYELTRLSAPNPGKKCELLPLLNFPTL